MVMEHCDAVLVFPFGTTSTTAPNQYLVKEATGWARFHGAPLVVQSGLGLAPGPDVCSIESPDLAPLDFILRFAEIAARFGWHYVGVFAAPLIAARCVRDLEHSGFRVIHVHVPENKRASFWFDRKSDRLWTQQPLIGWTRERLIRRIPWSIYSHISKE